MPRDITVILELDDEGCIDRVIRDGKEVTKGQKLAYPKDENYWIIVEDHEAMHLIAVTENFG